MKKAIKGKRVFVILMIVGMVFYFTGCGKKGPPVAPRGAPKPKAVSNLRPIIDGNILNLAWTIPDKDDETLPPLEGFIMYRYREPITKPSCQGCPILFKELADIPIVRKGPGDTMVYREKLVKGFRYFYQVRSYVAQGQRGRASNTVRFEF